MAILLTALITVAKSIHRYLGLSIPGFFNAPTLFKYLVILGKFTRSVIKVEIAEFFYSLLAFSFGDAVHDAGDPVPVCRHLDPPARESLCTRSHSATDDGLYGIYFRLVLN